MNFESIINIKPIRLVLFVGYNNCHFCDNPQGPCRLHYVSWNDRAGFISCLNPTCLKNAEKAVIYWERNYAYGRANFLRNTSLFVKRSSGIVEPGWCLSKTDTIVIDSKNGDCVVCCNLTKNLTKLVNIDELIQLNKDNLSIHQPELTYLLNIRQSYNCQFCMEPVGETFCHYISKDDCIGFFSCANCKKYAQEILEKWFETKAYGRAKSLYGKLLNVKLNDDTIEMGWTLSEKRKINRYLNGIECVFCENPQKTDEKAVPVNELLKLNEEHSQRIDISIEPTNEEILKPTIDNDYTLI